MKPKIGEIRRNRGLMQKYCAEKAEISQQLWSDYERGIKFPRIDKAYVIAKVLGVPINELYEEEQT